MVAQSLRHIAELHGASELAREADGAGDSRHIHVVTAAIHFHTAFQVAHLRQTAGLVDFQQALDISGAHVAVMGGKRLVAAQAVHHDIAAFGADFAGRSFGDAQAQVDRDAVAVVSQGAPVRTEQIVPGLLHELELQVVGQFLGFALVLRSDVFLGHHVDGGLVGATNFHVAALVFQQQARLALDGLREGLGIGVGIREEPTNFLVADMPSRPLPRAQHDFGHQRAQRQDQDKQNHFAAGKKRGRGGLRMSLRLHVIDELGEPPENDEDGPKLGDYLPGMNGGVEVLPQKDAAHPNQGQRPED